MEKRENAYLTVYLTLSLAVILTLCLLLIEGVRRNGAALEASCAADVGMQSIMAEYHRELQKQYNLFAIDSSYGTVSCGKRNTEAHLYHYLERNLCAGEKDFFLLDTNGVELTGVSILSDKNGAVFRKRAVEVIRDDVGLELLEQLCDWMETVEINGLEETNAEQEKALLDREIEEYEYTEERKEEQKIENPTEQLNEMRRGGILTLVLTDEQTLSERALDTEKLIGNRMKQGKANCGNLGDVSAEDSFLERFLFQEYLLRYMGYFGNEKEEGGLRYQLEYLIAGKNTDADNLRSFVWRLCNLREMSNAAYLFSDAEKNGEAEMMAAGICTALLVPELTPVLHATILLGWAYAESVCDVKRLMSGGKVPLLKDAGSWQLGLTEALSGIFEGESEEKGLSYEDYLRVFMMLTNEDILTVRAMDMVEADIRRTPGNEHFRLDACYDSVQAKINISGRHGYVFEAIREKTY